MTARRVDLGDLVVQGATWNFGLDDLVTEIALTWEIGQVAELSITSHDPGSRLAGTTLGTLGTPVAYLGESWQVGAIDAEYLNDDIAWTFRCRSALARALRRTVRTSGETQRSPSQWVTRRVKAHGGRAIVQASSSTATIAQSKDQAELDVIGSLASDLGWDWAEYGKAFVFCSKYHAWKKGIGGLPTRAITWKSDAATDALAATVTASDDDDEVAGTLEVSLPNATGKALRPFHRLQVTGLRRWDGTWLVQSVSYVPDGVTPVQVTAIIPKKPKPKDPS